jgi:hypothetical protein
MVLEKGKRGTISNHMDANRSMTENNLIDEQRKT